MEYNDHIIYMNNYFHFLGLVSKNLFNTSAIFNILSKCTFLRRVCIVLHSF